MCMCVCVCTKHSCECRTRGTSGQAPPATSPGPWLSIFLSRRSEEGRSSSDRLRSRRKAGAAPALLCALVLWVSINQQLLSWTLVQLLPQVLPKSSTGRPSLCALRVTLLWGALATVTPGSQPTPQNGYTPCRQAGPIKNAQLRVKFYWGKMRPIAQRQHFR